MNRNELVALELTCEKILSDVTKINCIISIVLSGNLKIQFGSSYITISKQDMHTPVWINYRGDYEELQQFILDVQQTIKEHEDEFNLLRSAYAHFYELDER